MAKLKKDAGPQVRVKVKGGINPKSKLLDGQPLHEDGQVYQPGEEFVCAEDRADAISHVVDILGPVEDPAKVADKL